MTRYEHVTLEEVKSLAFSSNTNNRKAILLQDLLIRMKDIKKDEDLLDNDFVFLQNSRTREIKMEIVNQ